MSNECNLEPNECELTLDVVDKIALRLMAAMMPSTGYYNKEGGNSQAYDAYEAADDFLKEKVKRDRFQITVEEAEEAGVDEEDCESAAIVKSLGPGRIPHLLVNDIKVAVVGSFCPDEKYRMKSLNSTGWSSDGLRRAAVDINEGVELNETS